MTAASPLTHRLHLERDEDVSGVSGTGVVAYGVEFPDGSVVLRWDTRVRSTVFYDSIADVETIAGHGGRTRVVFDDATEPPGLAEKSRALLDALYSSPFGRIEGYDDADRLLSTWQHGWSPIEAQESHPLYVAIRALIEATSWATPDTPSSPSTRP